MLSRAQTENDYALLFGWFRAGGDALFVKKELMLLADQRLVCAQGAAVPSSFSNALDANLHGNAAVTVVSSFNFMELVIWYKFRRC